MEKPEFHKAAHDNDAELKLTIGPPEIFTPVHEEYRVYAPKNQVGHTDGDTIKISTHELPLGM